MGTHAWAHTQTTFIQLLVEIHISYLHDGHKSLLHRDKIQVLKLKSQVVFHKT